MDSSKCWEQIDAIIAALDKGFDYLTTDEVEKTKLQKFYDDPRFEADEEVYLKFLQDLKMEEERKRLA